ncbi:MAG TPA: GAF domain-containing protein [Candidatus Limnocylindria bacterium]|nr:GAF domain-containing protein [Candidatus Limnocylindria bacterium]
MTQIADRLPSSSTGDPNAFLRDAAEEAARILQADGAIVYLLEPSGAELRFSVDAGIRNPEARELIRDLRLPVGLGMFGTAVERREPIVTDDYRRDRRFRHSPVADRIAAVAGMRSMAVAPLVVGDDVLGALGAYTARIGDFDEARVRLLQALADHAAARIANLRLIGELAQRVEAQRTLGSIAARITAIRETDELLQEVVDAAQRLLGSDGAHLTILDREQQILVPTVMAGHTDAETRAWLANERFPVNGGINGLAAGSGELTWTREYDSDPRIPHEPDDADAARRLGLCGMAAAPLRAPGGEIIGTLAVSYEQPHDFLPAELELLQRLADQAAIAIANARLHAELGESERRYRFLVDNSVDIMYTTDAEGRFTYLSERIEELSGFRPEELMGQHFMSASDPADAEALAAGWERLKAHPDEGLRIRFHLPTRDGRRIAAEVQGLGIVDEQGRFIGSRGAARDMSEVERLENELRQRADQLAHRVDAQRALAEIAAGITSLREPAEVLKRTTDEAARLLGGDHAVIQLLIPGSDVLADYRYEESDLQLEEPPEVSIRVGQGIAGRAMREGRPTWTDDYLADTSFEHTDVADEWIREEGFVSQISAPLVGERGPVGSLTVYSRRRAAFGEEAGELLGALASHAAVVLTNARLYGEVKRSAEQLQRRVELQRTLAEIGAQITALHDPPAVLQRTVDEAVRLVGASGGRIAVVQQAPDGERWSYGYSSEEGVIPRFSEDENVPREHGIAGWAMRDQRVVYTGDYIGDARFLHTPTMDRAIAEQGIRSAMAAPLATGPEPVGALVMYSTEADAFDDDDADLLSALAGQAAIALENARLYREERSAAEELTRRVEAQQTLADIAAQITSLRDAAAVLQRTVDEATRLLGADGGRIDLVDPTGSTLNWAYGSSPIDRRIVEGEVPDDVGGLDEGVAGRAVVEGRPVITGDYLADGRFRHVPWADSYIVEHGITSVMSAPLIGDDGGAIGALTVHSRQRDFFDADDAQLLGALASHAAVAVTNARLLERLRERVDAQRSLAEIAAQITSLRDPTAVLQRTVDEARRLLEADNVVINALSPDGDELGRPIAHAPADKVVDDVPTPVGLGLSGLAIAEERVVRTGDYVNDPGFRHTPEFDEYVRERGLRSLMAAPLIGSEGPIGVLTVRSGRQQAFDESDADLLGALASHAAVAITNARLYEQLGGRVETQRTLAEIAAQITSLTDPRAVLQRTVDEAVRLLGADAALVNPLAEDGEHLDLALAHAPAGERLDDVVVAIGAGISGRAISERAVMRTGDYLADPRFPHEEQLDDYIGRRQMRSVMSAPLLAPERPLGTLTVQSTRRHAFDESDADLLGLLANQAAVAITNARLYEELQRQSAELERQIASQQRLLGINENLLSALNPTGVLETIADALKQVVRYDNLAIYLVDRDARVLRPVLARDRHATEVMQHVLPLGQGITSWAVERGEPLLLNDARADPRAVQIPGTPNDPEAIIIVPLVAKGEVLGAMNIGRIGGEEVYFSQHDFELVQLFAGQAAIAVTNARLYEDLQQSEARYRFLVDNSPDIVWSVDADGRFTFFSDSLEQRTGWKPAELIGRHFSSFTAPSSVAIAEAAWERMQQDPTREERMRIELPLKDGRTTPVEIAMTSTVIDGRFGGAHGSVRDVSERERLEVDLRTQAAQLAASAERATLARELHDSVTQALFSMGLTMRSLELLLSQGQADAAAGKLNELRELQRDALAEMRTLIFELRPASLETDGLEQALRTHATAVGSRTGLAVTVETDLPDRLPLETEEALYRVAQEALHNVVKHAGASRTHIRLLRDPKGVRLAVSDDGRGFDPARVGRGHLGLVGMEQRAERIGGRLEVTSRPGDGTTVEVVLPLADGAPGGVDGADGARRRAREAAVSAE